mgnify:FL=1
MKMMIEDRLVLDVDFLTNAIFSLQIDETPINRCNASSQVDT